MRAAPRAPSPAPSADELRSPPHCLHPWAEAEQEHDGTGGGAGTMFLDRVEQQQHCPLRRTAATEGEYEGHGVVEEQGLPRVMESRRGGHQTRARHARASGPSSLASRELRGADLRRRELGRRQWSSEATVGGEKQKGQHCWRWGEEGPSR